MLCLLIHPIQNTQATNSWAANKRNTNSGSDDGTQNKTLKKIKNYKMHRLFIPSNHLLPTLAYML